MLSNYEKELFEKFSGKFTKQTKFEYLSKIEAFKDMLSSDSDLLSATKEDCNKFMLYVNDNYATSTSEKIYSYIHSFYVFLLKEGLIEFNPIHYVEKPTVSRIKTKDNVMSFQEMNQLIKVVVNLCARDKAIITLLITTGGMLSEVSNVKWCDLVLDTEDNKYCKLGKGKNTRVVKLHPKAFDYIVEYRRELDLPEEIIPTDDYIFVSKHKNKAKITDRTIQNILKNALGRADLQNYSAKDLRHTFASFCLYLGADTKLVKEQMGWHNKNQAITYKYAINFVDSKAIDYITDNKVLDFEDK